MRIAKWKLGWSAFLLPGVIAASDGSAALRLQVRPGVIEKTVTFNGARVRVEGLISNGSRAVIVIRGPERDESFSRKSRLGPIWLSAGRVQITGTPSVFLAFSTDPLKAILRRESIDEHTLDAEAISKRMHIDPPGDAADALPDHYLGLRRRQGRYRFEDGGIRLASPASPGVNFDLEFDWPKAAPSAPYEVWLYEVRGGVVTGSAHVPLEVRRAGFPAWMATFANQYAWLYGLVAVAISVLSGFGIDFLVTRIFGKRRVGAH